MGGDEEINQGGQDSSDEAIELPLEDMIDDSGTGIPRYTETHQQPVYGASVLDTVIDDVQYEVLFFERQVQEALEELFPSHLKEEGFVPMNFGMPVKERQGRDYIWMRLSEKANGIVAVYSRWLPGDYDASRMNDWKSTGQSITLKSGELEVTLEKDSYALVITGHAHYKRTLDAIREGYKAFRDMSNTERAPSSPQMVMYHDKLALKVVFGEKSDGLHLADEILFMYKVIQVLNKSKP